MDNGNLLPGKIIRSITKSILIHISSSVRIYHLMNTDRIVFAIWSTELNYPYFLGKIIIQDKLASKTKVQYIINKLE